MRNNSNEMSTGAALLLTFGIILVIGMIGQALEPNCSMSGCKKDAKEGSSYCYSHDMSYRTYGNPDYNAVYRESVRKRNSYSTDSGSSASSKSNSTSGSTSKSSSSSSKSSTKSYNSYDSYDDGYDDVYFDDDYDWDRYYSDEEYALGVDDAMDDLDW